MSENSKTNVCPHCGEPIERTEESLFDAFQSSWKPIRARSEQEADFLRRQAAGETSSAEDAFGF